MSVRSENMSKELSESAPIATADKEFVDSGAEYEEPAIRGSSSANVAAYLAPIAKLIRQGMSSNDSANK